jgi:hypothetical protein
MNIKLLTTATLFSAFLYSGFTFAEEGEVENKNVKTTISINQPRDAASGKPTGKRQHKPFTVTKPVDKASPLMAKKPPVFTNRAQGLPTGKRSHAPAQLTKELDKSSPMLARGAYRLCPDGTMINPGEKCPEKAVRAGYKLCPDGSMINPGEKCPEKAVRAGYKLCPDGTMINPGEKCPEKKKQRLQRK